MNRATAFDYFTNDPEVLRIVEEVKLETAGKQFSDVIDNENNQYVDLVQEGGGVLGIALLGYTYILEKAGIRFFSLGGTSAGAINTILLAASGRINKTKTDKIVNILADKNLFDFIDAPFFIRIPFKTAGAGNNNSIINRFFRKAFVLLWFTFWLIPIIIYLLKNKGINPGKSFQNWISSVLKEYGIRSEKDLEELRARPYDLRLRENSSKSIDDLNPKLKIIAAEIKTETRVIFPEMGHLFWNSPETEDPAQYVRASMSIPVFFRSFGVTTGNAVKKEFWETTVDFNGEVPKEALFVDGGVLSNFPIDVFHNPNNVPRLPTFGVKLGYDRNTLNPASTLSKYLLAIFNSARHVLDYQFLLKNRDYKKLITLIDTGNHNWLNFNISQKDKVDLFIRGAKAAREFLKKFDWNDYKTIRAKLLGIPETGTLKVDRS